MFASGKCFYPCSKDKYCFSKVADKMALERNENFILGQSLAFAPLDENERRKAEGALIDSAWREVASKFSYGPKRENYSQFRAEPAKKNGSPFGTISTWYKNEKIEFEHKGDFKSIPAEISMNTCWEWINKR